MLKRASVEVADKELLARLESFIGSLLAVERQHDDASTSEAVLNSGEWEKATRAANNLLSYANDWPATRPAS